MNVRRMIRYLLGGVLVVCALGTVTDEAEATESYPGAKASRSMLSLHRISSGISVSAALVQPALVLVAAAGGIRAASAVSLLLSREKTEGRVVLPRKLEQGVIERAVASQRGRVKRSCWEPAFSSRDPRAPKAAKVSVSLVIDPTGSVRTVSVSGGTGYPGLSTCIEDRVRDWSFPRAEGESQASIPFAFFSQ